MLPVMVELPYTRLPDAPTELSARSVMVRLVDGLGFRYRWATEGLSATDPEFGPGQDSMTLRQLMVHVSGLARWVLQHLGGEPRPAAGEDTDSLRERTLLDLVAIRERLLAIDDTALASITIASKRSTESFWHMINGPLADALTHVGQINAWRRLAGNPTPRADVFRGQPPADRNS